MDEKGRNTYEVFHMFIYTVYIYIYIHVHIKHVFIYTYIYIYIYIRIHKTCGKFHTCFGPFRPSSGRYIYICIYIYIHTNIRRLTTGIRLEKCFVRRYRRCASVYLHKSRQYSIAQYTPRLYGKAYCSQATNLYSTLLY